MELITGTIGLVILLIALVAALIASASYETTIIGLAALIVGVFLLQAIFSISVIAYLTANLFALAVGILVFTAIGLLWGAFYKLPQFIDKNSDAIERDFHDFVQQFKRTDMVKARNDFISSSYFEYSIRNNKDTAFSWVLLWPASMLWEAIKRPVDFLWNNVYIGIGRAYERLVTQRVLKILKGKGE